MRAFLLFLLVGGLGFVIDAGLTQALILGGLSPFVARVPAIAVAMLFTWLANRALTYRVAGAASLREALRYFSVASVMASLNFLVYALLIHAGLPPLACIVLATALQTLLSFFGYRKFAFKA